MPWEAMTLDALAELEAVAFTGEVPKAPFAAKGEVDRQQGDRDVDR
jgi:hypothetical protein